MEKETKFLLKKYGISANKKLGQNFLINKNAIEQIINGANIEKDDLVIEIGPGLGTLTSLLLEKAKKVICIELDDRMVEILKDRFKLYDNFNIIQDDVLKVDLQSLIKKDREKYANVKIVANLPYYITTPIITKLLESRLDLESITVMIQKEVAERLIEKPGGKNTGAITYCIYYYCDAERVVEVSKESFIPQPKVTSEVIKLKLRSKPVVDVIDEEKLFKVIRCAFMQRRKTLLNSLTNTGIFENKEEGQKILEDLNIDINIRPEKMSLEKFAAIVDKIS